MKTFNNPSINAKLKAMYSKKLKKEDLEDLMKQNHIKDGKNKKTCSRIY